MLQFLQQVFKCAIYAVYRRKTASSESACELVVGFSKAAVTDWRLDVGHAKQVMLYLREIMQILQMHIRTYRTY